MSSFYLLKHSAQKKLFKVLAEQTTIPCHYRITNTVYSERENAVKECHLKSTLWSIFNEFSKLSLGLKLT